MSNEINMLNLQAELNKMRLSRTHIFVIVMALLLVLLDGYDILIVSYSLPLMAKEWALTPPLAGSLVSAGLVGLSLGSATGGMLADRFGRRPTLIGALLVASVGSIAVAAFANSHLSFLVLRVVSGLGLGVLLPLASVYVTEFAPGRASNLFVGLCQVGFGIGGTTAAALGISLVPEYGWQSLYWAGGCGVPFAFACFWLLPETPKYLALRGRRESLRLLMCRLAPEQEAGYAAATFYAEGSPDRSDHGASVLLSRRYRRNTLCVWIAAFCVVLATYGSTGWLPSIMIARGAGNAGGFALGGLLQFASIFGMVGMAFAADRSGAPRLTIGFALCAGGAALAGMVGVGASWEATALVFLIGFFVIGITPMIYNFVASLYPTEVRGAGVGIMLAVGRTGGICGPIIGGFLLQTFGTPVALFLTYGAAAVCGAALIVSVRPARG